MLSKKVLRIYISKYNFPASSPVSKHWYFKILVLYNRIKWIYKKLPELISEFIKVVEYKVNTQKSILSLH